MEFKDFPRIQNYRQSSRKRYLPVYALCLVAGVAAISALGSANGLYAVVLLMVALAACVVTMVTILINVANDKGAETRHLYRQALSRLSEEDLLAAYQCRAELSGVEVDALQTVLNDQYPGWSAKVS